jgi:predicted lipase
MKKLLFLVPFFQYVFGFDFELATRNLHIAAASYCDIDQLTSWNCKHCDNDIQVQAIIPDESTIIIARDSVQNATVFAFRGSVNVENWISNLQFSVVEPYEDRDIKVHKGLYHEYLRYKDEISAYLVPGDKIVLTGHSSGAAMSLFFAYDIYKDYDVVVYTFGKPRIGNAKFAESTSAIQHFRVTHADDIVPHIPEEVLGYRHTGLEVWNYDDTSNNYKVCADNEDKSCSNSCAPLHCTSIPDHLFYLGMEIGSMSC